MGYETETEYLLTIIVPLYNEEGNLPRLAKELSGYLFKTTCKAKVLFVNDGSTDNSAEILEKICSANRRFSFISLGKNSGLSTALKAGIDQVDTRLTGYIDADLQTSPFDFDLLLAHTDNYELVTGIRVKRQDGLIKRISSGIANAIRRTVTRDGVSDTGCPLKVIHTDIARRIPLFKGMHRFLPALVQLEGGKVKGISVNHYKRLSGRSKYHLSNRLFTTLADLIAFTWIRKRYIRYEISGRG
jgi:dolichol-phosphate mannosyltransferase